MTNPNAVPSADDLRREVRAHPDKHGLNEKQARLMAALTNERLEKALRDAAAEDTVVSLAIARLDDELAEESVRNRLERLTGIREKMWPNGKPEGRDGRD